MSKLKSKVPFAPSHGNHTSFRLNPLYQILFGSLGVFLPFWAFAQEVAAPATEPAQMVAQLALSSTGEQAAVQPVVNAAAPNQAPVQVAALDHAALSQGVMKGFSTAFLQGLGASVDVKTLLSSSEVIAGNYRVDLLVNTLQTSRIDVNFTMNAKTGEVEPCLTKEMLAQAGVDMAKIDWEQAASQDPSCLRLPELIPQATAQFDAARLRLNLNIPQVYMSQARRGYVEPSQWSEGVPVAFANYNFSSRFTNNSGGMADQRSTNLGLNMGVNIGPWHFRNNSYLSSGSQQSTQFRSQNTYIQRDLTDLRSQLWLGETYTASPLFDSVRFRGVQMASDDAMLPDSMQGYAPVIRGNAESNATIEVRQNGFLIYSTNVAPGPFEITDLAPSGTNGNLEITVVEADGRRRVSVQAFSAPPLMVREGRLKYDATVGQFRNNYNGGSTPAFGSASALYGLTSNITLAGGMQAAPGYQILSGGAGLNTTVGAFSLDAAHSRSSVNGDTNSGSRLRFNYRKFFESTATQVSFTAQESLNEGFRNLNDHVQARNWAGNESGLSFRSVLPRSQLSMYLSQNLGVGTRYGSIYTSATAGRNWDGSKSNSVSAGYSNTLGPASFNVSLTHSRNVASAQYASGRQSDTGVFLSVTFPLGKGSNAPNMYTNVGHQKAGTNVQTGISGRLPNDRDISYSVMGQRDVNGDASASAFLGASTSMAVLNAGYSYGNRSNTASVQASGSIVAHQGGINLGQPVGETFALAQVEPAVPGVRVSSYRGVATGNNGYAVIPNAVPYRANWIAIDATGLSADVEIEGGMEQVVPRRGAVPLATFKSEEGRRVQFELTQPDGSPMPFGAIVEGADGSRLGITDTRGRVLTMLEQDQAQGQLRVIWEEQECRIGYDLPAKEQGENYQRMALSCTDAKPVPTPTNKSGSGVAQATDPDLVSKQGS
ncbi:fimbrial biogenesis outer membrane usher protein [Comamonas sp. Tr-654]|uniref:fimbria/pilus outer membrane usher protein n=1 Tax=Comamonas sp. Tr-654 TaxID=2608341 RepID=UPI00141FA57F|nr:fimbria/pilus outer membrane usher protein [Comamonas sp. Tr-654]NIF85151.1 fimbrial biogenesis outer membrane usher protein [Comamonas sp. Tr-654]